MVADSDGPQLPERDSWYNFTYIRGWYTYDVHFEGVGGKAKMRCYRTQMGGGSESSGRPIFIFLLQKIGFAPCPDIMLSQALIYFWQEVFLLTLMSDNEAIL